MYQRCCPSFIFRGRKENSYKSSDKTIKLRDCGVHKTFMVSNKLGGSNEIKNY